LHDFQESENLVDAILARAQNSHGQMDPTTKEFAVKMKAFFLKFQGDDKGSAKIMEQASGTLYDVEVLKDMFTKIELGATKNAVVYKEGRLVRIRGQQMDDDINLVKLEIAQNPKLIAVFNAIFESFARH